MNSHFYRAAVIGCGNIGAGDKRYSSAIQPSTHAGAFSGHPRIKLVALADMSDERIKQTKQHFPDIPFFTDAKEMMTTLKPDIVSIATPTDTHDSILREVAEYEPRAIICEKPIAHSLDAAERMIHLCKSQNTILFINHMRRFDPPHRRVRTWVENFGPVMQVTAHYTRGIYNNGTHIIDLLTFFLGRVKNVWGIRNTATEGFNDLPGDQNIDGFLLFESGARASLHTVDSNDYNIFDIHLYGKKGQASMQHFGFKHIFRNVVNCKEYQGHRELDEESADCNDEPRSYFLSMADHVVACLDGVDKPISTGEDGLVALRVITRLIESARQGGVMVSI